MNLASPERHQNPAQASSSPRVSVVYLTKNGGPLLRESLQAVLAQTTDFAFEVVAVDSGSTDGTLEFLQGQPVKIHTIPPESFNFGATRDLGFSLGQGEILVTLSQDAVPAGPDWLQNLCRPFVDPGVAAVQGKERPWAGRDVFFWSRVGLFNFTRESQRWRKAHQGVGLSFVNCAVRRSVWEANRLGPVAMSEDKVFQKRLAEQGHRIVRAPEAVVWHSHQYDRESLVKRCMNEGLGWRLVGVEYSGFDMLVDMCHPFIWLGFAYGLVTLRIRTAAELLFPWLRPYGLYKGNHAAGGYFF